MRVDEALIVRAARDHFEGQITETVAKLGGTPSERLEVARSIVTSFDEAIAEVLHPVSLRIVERDRNAKQFKELLKSPPAPPRGARGTKRS